jgi:hypothetical protein
MNRNEAVRVAVSRVDETGWTFVVLRRGSKYQTQMLAYPVARGWKVAEQIGPGNVQNFRELPCWTGCTQ